MTKIIDCHCHVYPDKIALKAAEAIGRFYSIDMDMDGTLATLKAEAKKAGITHCVVFSVATKPSQTDSINSFIADTVAASGGTMTGLGTLHPDSPDLKGDVERIISLGLKGVKLHPDIQGFKIDDYRCLKIYELCEGRLPVLLHTGDKRYDYSNPNRLKPVLEIFKGLTVIGAHFGGWSIWEEATEELYGYENLLVDCSSSLYALTPEKATELVRKYGAEKVLFGIDFPMWRPKDEVERFNKLDLTDEERELILHRNAEKVFSIPS
ncbi:MAG: amidohydrolase family protein [Clostridia bacterium]|nr:amidohydrolase family protein [Clostridia bacterium]